MSIFNHFFPKDGDAIHIIIMPYQVDSNVENGHHGVTASVSYYYTLTDFYNKTYT
ncbi:hypothetical protein [Chondrinema litorale]|uniref:hypothetical protein n=1 Tax=Chondrinema litorale TaxID=2994555 RepID=UPI002543ECEB|nr:hypothetical protein [Chondrinema litorale]UZR99586.1 hypothetical protein OQ292_37625 [Chondrinema litorale]